MLLRRLTRLILPLAEPRARARQRRRGAVGAVVVEYAFLLVAVGVPLLAGLTIGGQHLYNGYINGRDAMLSPFP